MGAKLLTVLAAVWLAGGVASGQAGGSVASTPTGLVVGSGNFFSPIVSDLDKAIAFYRDGLGLDASGTPSSAEANPALRNMFGLPDAQIRWLVARPPAMRTGVEMVEVSKAGGRPAERRVQDSGAVTLIVLVRDLDAVFARVKQAGAPVVTTGGGPMTVGGGKTRAVVVKDPDGHFIELAQLDPLPETTAPASANVIGVRVRLTVDDAPQAMRLYRDVMGLQQRTLDDFKNEPSVSAMLGLQGARFRIGMAQVPASGLIVEFIEFAGVDRRAVRSSLQDPGSTRMQLQVRDIDAAIAALKGAGGTVVSTGGGPVELAGRAGGPSTKVAIVRDPNNLFVVLIQAPPAASPAAPRNP